MDNRICAQCGADDLYAREIEGQGLELRRTADAAWECADECSAATIAGLDALGILERVAVADIARLAGKRIAVMTLRDGKRAAATPAGNTQFWGDLCYQCGRRGVELGGVGQDRRCVDGLDCIIQPVA